MRVVIKIERDAKTLSRWNFKEEALVLYDNRRHTAIPLSKVTTRWLRKPMNLFMGGISHNPYICIEPRIIYFEADAPR